jgi:predicted Zn finger-like uncharacterized protein
MYTQCPECQIAFRVTANVLQQASGNVRCGNCNHAFNALQYLSEEMPEPATVEDASTEDLSHDELTETSRRLLETLDELAGSEDVRIEDTGVEWRVLDEAAMDLGGAAMDEGQADQTAADEPRYDDNTPLPEDFDGEPDVARAAIPQRRDEDHTPRGGDLGDRQGDLALSEPEDWTDILKEVSDPDAEPIEVEEELIAIHNELASIDDALTDEVPQLEDDEFDDTPAFGDDETEQTKTKTKTRFSLTGSTSGTKTKTGISPARSTSTTSSATTKIRAYSKLPTHLRTQLTLSTIASRPASSGSRTNSTNRQVATALWIPSRAVLARLATSRRQRTTRLRKRIR